MSPRQWRHRLQDILAALGKISSYTSGMQLSDFASDPKTVDAVIRNLIVIGEAAGHMPPEIVQAHPGIPWRLMADLRNFAVHEYWSVEVPTLWETLKEDLPPLVGALEAILARAADQA